jgi:5-methylcytosine-specific restriction enzyme A
MWVLKWIVVTFFRVLWWFVVETYRFGVWTAHYFWPESRPKGVRSPLWPGVRKKHLVKQPVCQICGGSQFLNVHHIEPFHINPDKELDEGNLITLCEKPGFNCHFLFGHLLDWHSWNKDILKDVRVWAAKIVGRPH